MDAVVSLKSESNPIATDEQTELSITYTSYEGHDEDKEEHHEDRDIFDFDWNENEYLDRNTNFAESKVNIGERLTSASIDRRPSSPRKAKTVYENTYRMEPKPDQYFLWYKVRNVICNIVEPLYELYTYDAKTAGPLCKMICTRALAAVKRKFDWPRYRYVCHVTLVQSKMQGFIIGDRTLWFPTTDSYAPCVFKNKDSVLVLTLHGIFQE